MKQLTHAELASTAGVTQLKYIYIIIHVGELYKSTEIVPPFGEIQVNVSEMTTPFVKSVLCFRLCAPERSHCQPHPSVMYEGQGLL